ncbi:hypothetical protein [Nonomuraea jiangxiensis]|uniref:Uncharacterized protein n=1 Tax=Nonomuraea jiangxiensis TaxID=633440 RepID=A0A1G9HY10_9ACTN|nr:hypothetical protein [Nonomuraea jiangxiensis]SDL17839.1 hypothetical protein SAMN05421869_12320 [Nonomuraea jiangxiensis]
MGVVTLVPAWSNTVVSEETWSPEWCIVGTLLPYPYSQNGPHAEFRSQKIFPAGAKLYVVGGFAGMGYETVTVVGYAHRRRRPVRAHIQAKYVGGWRAQLVYRPVILRAINDAQLEEHNGHRWLVDRREGRRVVFQPGEPEYGAHLAEIAAGFQRTLHGS